MSRNMDRVAIYSRKSRFTGKGESIDNAAAIKLAKSIAFDFGYGDMVDVWSQVGEGLEQNYPKRHEYTRKNKEPIIRYLTLWKNSN